MNGGECSIWKVLGAGSEATRPQQDMDAKPVGGLGAEAPKTGVIKVLPPTQNKNVTLETHSES